MKLKRLGVWAGIDPFRAADAAAFAKRVETWGYGALWIPEAVGREDEHWKAGADHVCVQAVGEQGRPDERLLSLLAPGR
ncbi:MAG: hypothetical protein ACLP2F_04685 [Steroidobacteraceae bacterium]